MPERPEPLDLHTHTRTRTASGKPSRVASREPAGACTCGSCRQYREREINKYPACRMPVVVFFRVGLLQITAYAHATRQLVGGMFCCAEEVDGRYCTVTLPPRTRIRSVGLRVLALAELQLLARVASVCPSFVRTSFRPSVLRPERAFFLVAHAHPHTREKERRRALVAS